MRPRPIIGSWFAGAVIWKKLEDGELALLLQTSKTTLPEYAGQGDQTKFPGGGNEPEDADFFATLKRELLGETGLSFKVDIEPMIIHRVSRRHQHDANKLHLQVFYVFPDDTLVGHMRTEEIIDGTSVLSPPEWVRVRDIFRQGVLYRTHATALRKVIEHLAITG